MTVLVGGRYQLEGQIGQGGMGIVHRAVDTRTGQIVAIKQLRRDTTSARPELIERFLREAEALRELNHPNIVRAFGTVVEGKEHFIIMDYVKGRDLRQYLQQYGRLSIVQTVRIGLEVADALTRAHYLKIVHRDLKPANILITDDGVPRLTDFGVAYFTGYERVTDASVALGTPHYMAPELLRGDLPDFRADIWSLGVILFELLAGKHPFHADSITELLMNIVASDPPDLETIREDVPVALADLIYRMLIKDHDARIPSIRLVGTELEPILQLLTLGGRRITPLATPVISPGDAETTPDSKRSVRNNLPAIPAPFVGRDSMIGELVSLLNLPDVRLLTITGTGGVGKSRLAVEVAHRIAELSADSSDPLLARYSHGVFWVPLANLSRPELLSGAIASAIGLRYAPGGDQIEQLTNYLRSKSILLVIDSADQALGGIGLLADLLNISPHLKIMATSRTRLKLMGETTYMLEGLWIEPDATPEQIVETSAYALFLVSARRANPNFSPSTHDVRKIAEIIGAVSGLPLGIEMAAAWVNQLSVDEIAAEVAESLDFLSRDNDNRHGSLRAVFEQSWALLSDDERHTVTNLAVFRGRFSRAAGQKVAQATLRQLMSLVNKGILRRSPDSDIYHIDRLTRQFAEERLNDSPDAPAIRDAHMEYYLHALADRLPRLYTGDQRETMRAIHLDTGNVRAAWFRAVKYARYELLDMAVATLAVNFEMVGQYDEAENVVSAAVESVERLDATPARDAALSHLLMWYAILQSNDGDPVKAEAALERAEALLNEESTELHLAALALAQGLVYLNFGNPVDARPCLAQAVDLYRMLGPRPEVGRTQILLGRAYYFRLGADAMDLNEARRILTEARDECERIGDEYGLANSLFCLGTVAMYAAEIEQTINLLRRAEAAARRFGGLHLAANALNNLGYALLDAGRISEARETAEENLAIRRDQGIPLLIAWALFACAQIDFADGTYMQGIARATEGLTLVEHTNHLDWVVNMLYARGLCQWVVGDLAGAAKGFDRMLDVAREIEDIDNQCLALTQRGAVAYAEDDLAGAQERFASSAELARSINDPNLIAYNRVWSGIVLLDMEDYEEAQRSLIDALEYLTDDSAQRLSYTWMEMNRYDTITLAHSTLANIALRIGNLTSARERLWLAMRAAQRIGGARITLRTLSSVAELLLLRGDLLHALEWCGALLSSPATGAIYQRPLLAIVDRIQPLLSFEEFDAALEHGRMLSLDQLMNKANSVLRHG
ncbi:MAG: hypothetical protein DCC53_04785 [Chloroflexi bacterium]|nr:Serine/threonine-protein kinase PknD [Anaerolineae bacterium]RIK22048.1 MAG: hypothetical protein DCC53_04785 [Chloroflexota bacterium]